MPELTDRQRKAIAGLFYKRGGSVKRYKSKRPYGTDAYIAGEAKVLALNPYRMPSEFVLLFDSEQHGFLMEMADVWARGAADRKVGDAMADEVREEVMG